MTDNFGIPGSWAWAKLRDVVTSIDAGKSFTCEARPARDGEWGIIKVSAMTWGEFRESENKAVPAHRPVDPRYEIRPGDILISRANTEAYVGAPVLVRSVRPRLLLSDKSLRLKSATEIDSRWLLHTLASPHVRRQISLRATGQQDSMRNISQQALLDIDVPVPPLAEQRRTVAALEGHLSRLTSAIAQLEAVSRRVARFQDQVMQLVSTGGLDSGKTGDGQASILEPAGVQDGELPAIPSSWQWHRLGEIAEVVGGVTKDSKRQSDPTFVEVPYLRVANVQRGRLKLDDVARIRVPEKKATQLRLQTGDVLLNEGGDRDKLGRGWVWEDQIPGCIHQNHVFRVRLHSGTLHPKLLAWHANGFGRRWFQANGLQSVNLASISLGKMKLFPVPVPPLEQQAELVAAAEEYLSLLEKMTSAVSDARQKANHLRVALLGEAFAGRLVPQDPNDEPASELLARIRAERAAAVPVKRARAARAPRTRKELAAPPTRVTGDNYEQGALPL